MITTLYRFVASGITIMVLLGDLSDAARLKAYVRYEACRRTTAEAYISFGCGVSLFRIPQLIVKTSK
jgi:hypothetical protein